MKVPPRTPLTSVPMLPIKGSATQPEALPSPAPRMAVVASLPAYTPTVAVELPVRGGTVSMNLRMTPELNRALRIASLNTGESGTQIILRALRKELGVEIP